LPCRPIIPVFESLSLDNGVGIVLHPGPRREADRRSAVERRSGRGGVRSPLASTSRAETGYVRFKIIKVRRAPNSRLDEAGALMSLGKSHRPAAVSSKLKPLGLRYIHRSLRPHSESEAHSNRAGRQRRFYFRCMDARARTSNRPSVASASASFSLSAIPRACRQRLTRSPSAVSRFTTGSARSRFCSR
jgi:hypothetical protein